MAAAVFAILDPIIEAVAVAFEVLMSPIKWVGDLFAWVGDWVLYLGRSISDALYNLVHPFNPRDTAGSSPGGFNSDAFTGLKNRITAIIGANGVQFDEIDYRLITDQYNLENNFLGPDTTSSKPPDYHIELNIEGSIYGSAGLAQVGQLAGEEVAKAIQQITGISKKPEFLTVPA